MATESRESAGRADFAGGEDGGGMECGEVGFGVR